MKELITSLSNKKSAPLAMPEKALHNPIPKTLLHTMTEGLTQFFNIFDDLFAKHPMLSQHRFIDLLYISFISD